MESQTIMSMLMHVPGKYEYLSLVIQNSHLESSTLGSESWDI